MVRLNQDAFLTQLTKLYASTKQQGSVTVTTKRHVARPTRAQSKNENFDKGPFCLVRASSGKRKISTLVEEKDLSRFQSMFSNILIVHMDALKKREKPKRNATKKSS